MAQYVSNPVNEQGIIDWSEEENRIWHDLVERQLDLVKDRACKEYLRGLELLDLPLDRAPQLTEINSVLQRETGWQVEPVPALIDFDRFFELLASRKFLWRHFYALEKSLTTFRSPTSSMRSSATAPC
ncbi:phenylalanine-4-hydroxylase [Vibrio maritimus]|uniref:Phenylalanine-4-hydroxylase n=1 Tax=Vibrio maritimus TaxID=990268 RepID=A0A090SVY8_9VIBR|nr:phenylalanine-4-hydroxylase [Vibrio maritimus]